jgi:myo-inositol 2-dehydrogenase / D-chiro-inositol 1-dehydrogenase
VSAPPRSPADVRIGIVGCGRAATSLHVPALRRVRGAAVVALSDCDEARLRHLASRCEGAAGFADYGELLADARVDLVAVCVPAAVHAPVALAALQAGKHVLIEKPLALTLEDCDRLVEQAARSESGGIRSAVGFNLRSHRLVGQAREAIRSGRLGEIEMVRTLWTADWSGGGRPPWHAVRSRGGGALLEIGTHQADLWRHLLGSEVETIQALSRSTVFDDQTAVFEARMANGVLVSAAVSQRSASHNMVEVYGERGSLRFSCYHADSMSLTGTGRRETGAWRRLGPVLGRAAALPGALKAARQGGDFQASYVRQWERILAALASGAPMPASVHDGRQAARVVDAGVRSSQERAAERPAERPAEPAEAG